MEDLAQDTFVRLFTSPARGGDTSKLRGMLLAVARNLLFNSLRDDWKRPGLVETERAWGEFERDDQGSAYLDALRSCLEGLPQRTRDILRLH